MKLSSIAIVLGLSLTVSSAQAQQSPRPPFDPERMRSAMSEAVGMAFGKIDANQDGQLTRDEVSTFVRQHGGGGRMMNGEAWARSDTNGDGVVSRSEFVATMMHGFDLPAKKYGEARQR